MWLVWDKLGFHLFILVRVYYRWVFVIFPRFIFIACNLSSEIFFFVFCFENDSILLKMVIFFKIHAYFLFLNFSKGEGESRIRKAELPQKFLTKKWIKTKEKEVNATRAKTRNLEAYVLFLLSLLTPFFHSKGDPLIHKREDGF